MNSTSFTALKKRLSVNPFLGKPLHSTFLREKKFDGKRAYFLVYEEFNAILFAATSDKKAQQETINQIKADLPKYATMIRELTQRA